MNYLKQKNETQFEYLKRLTFNRKELDLSYSQWAKLVADYECSNDNGRKACYLVKSLLLKLEEELEDGLKVEIEGAENLQELIQELEEKKIELQKERVKLQTLRVDLNKSIREESRRELFYEQLSDLVKKHAFAPPTFNEIAYEDDRDKGYLQLFADIHFGSTFSIKQNQYSVDIVKERFEKLLSETKHLIKKEQITHLYVANLSDSIQGILRLSDLTLNSITLTEQIYGVVRVIAGYLNELSKDVEITYLQTIDANHSEIRLLGSKAGEIKNDVELLIGQWINDLLIHNERVEVVIADDTVLDLELCGYQLGLCHGQGVKNFSNHIHNITMAKRKFYDYFILGHIHHYKVETVSMGEGGQTVQMIACPSMVGSCEYSKKLLKLSPAGALLLCFEEGKGKALTYEITL